MGWANCRFREETGCLETGSQEYHVELPSQKLLLNIPSMWKHYAIEHLVQPSTEEREAIMAANPEEATGTFIGTRSARDYAQLKIFYVEKTDNGYTHEVGEKPDTKFIEKLESILIKIPVWQTKGTPGFR